MAQMKAKELRNLSVDELDEKYEVLKKELFQMRIQAKLQKLTNVSKINQIKRLAAKILTVKHELQNSEKKS